MKGPLSIPPRPVQAGLMKVPYGASTIDTMGRTFQRISCESKVLLVFVCFFVLKMQITEFLKVFIRHIFKSKYCIFFVFGLISCFLILL